MNPLKIAMKSRAPGLVVGDPVLDAIPQMTRYGIGVVQKGIDRGALRPASLILQSLRQVPVVERGPGLQTALQQTIDQT